MTPHDSPRQAENGPDRPGDTAGGPARPDPLESLSERLRHAQEAADRLVREATEAAQRTTQERPAGGSDGPGRPPPRGYAVPNAGPERSSAADIQALAALLDLGRALLPPELREQLAALVREILLLIRALVDWYLERIDARRRESVEVQDIPIS